MSIKGFAHDFPLHLNEVKTTVNLYNFDTGSDIFLEHDYLNRYLPMTVRTNEVTFTVHGKSVTVQSKEAYENKVQDRMPNTNEIELFVEKLARLKTIIRHADIHGLEIIQDIKQKIETDCTSNYPDAFWMKEQYFVDLPYCEGYADRPQKTSANYMSPSELEYCKTEIAELLKRKRIEPSRSPWASPAFYVNKHSEQKKGKPRMVINYRALNKALFPIRYPIPSKDALFAKIGSSNVFNKFDLKRGLADWNHTKR